jgi:hypothetical protein
VFFSLVLTRQIQHLIINRILEFVDGGNFQDYLNQQKVRELNKPREDRRVYFPLSEEEALNWIRQLGE